MTLYTSESHCHVICKLYNEAVNTINLSKNIKQPKLTKTAY